jgi:Bacteriophage clamp loader A subunit
MPDLGDFLKSINNNKNDLLEDPALDPKLVEKQYKGLAYVINRIVGYFPDTIFHAQEMNMRSTLDGKMQYLYYLHSLPKRSRWAKGIKAENPQHLEIVKEYYNYSTRKARQALEILSEENLKYIQARLYQGGLVKKKKET